MPTDSYDKHSHATEYYRVDVNSDPGNVNEREQIKSDNPLDRLSMARSTGKRTCAVGKTMTRKIWPL